MAIPVYPRAAELTCRGKAGKSTPHPHYAGRTVVWLARVGWVTRCTSCGQICAAYLTPEDSAAGYQPIEVTPELAIRFMNRML